MWPLTGFALLTPFFSPPSLLLLFYLFSPFPGDDLLRATAAFRVLLHFFHIVSEGFSD